MAIRLESKLIYQQHKTDKRLLRYNFFTIVIWQILPDPNVSLNSFVFVDTEQSFRIAQTSSREQLE